MTRLRQSPRSPGREIGSREWCLGILALALAALVAGCASAGIGRLHNPEPLAPRPDSTSKAEAGREREREREREAYYTLFGVAEDTTVGFQSGTADTTRRYLGRLKFGYTADTLNLFLLGDNRPAYRVVKFQSNFNAVRGIFSLNPLRIVKGLVSIPWILIRGTIPDFSLWRDIPDILGHTPRYGREHQVMNAMLTKLDSLKANGQSVAAVINSGDLVKDGRRPAQWMRFLRIVRPLSRQSPYFAIAGNHERTDDPIGLDNWKAATGLPIASDRIYYCFDSADGWVRFLALDSNPIVDPSNHWARDVEIKYSEEQIDWLVARLKEHTGPAIVFLHHPPFSLGFHKSEWQTDPVLRERRARMVRALQESGLSVIIAGHEHAYERALLRSGDGVLIMLVLGGAGSPLHSIPVGPAAAQSFTQYQLEGSRFEARDVFAAMTYHFVHMRIWFGGGEFTTYAVDKKSNMKVIDHATIDLERYGVPKVDQFKIPVAPSGPQQKPPKEETAAKKAVTAKSDSTSASQRIRSEPPPGKKVTPRRTRRR